MKVTRNLENTLGAGRRRYCLALDLKNDPKLISEYEKHHQNIWPEITASLKDSGILDLEIYRLGTRMFMIIEVDDQFSFERKRERDRANAKVREWEELMWKFQQPLHEAKADEKWVPMKRIFKLEGGQGMIEH